MDGQLNQLNPNEALVWPPEAVTAARQAQHEAEHQLEFFTTDTLFFTAPPEAPKTPPECPATRCNHTRPKDRQGRREPNYRQLPRYYLSANGRCFDRWLWDRVREWRSFCDREGLSSEDFPSGFTYLR